MLIDHKSLYQKKYKNIFFVQNRDFWHSRPFEYNSNTDLVLTFDFGLLNSIICNGGDAGFIDHLCESNEMEKYNYDTYNFFGSWYKDKNGEDIFRYNDIDISSVFRVEIWNFLTYYPRILVNILKIEKIKYKNLYVGVLDECALKVLNKAAIKYKEWTFNGELEFHEYYFPVFRWMNDAIYGNNKNENIEKKIKSFILIVSDYVFKCFDVLISLFKKETFVFAWDYFPTRRIIEKLLADKKVRVVGPNYWMKSFYSLRRLPLCKKSKKYSNVSAELIRDFQNKKNAKWSIKGIDIGEVEYEKILEVVRKSLPDHIRKLVSIIKYFRNRNLRMIVTVGNLGILNCLMMSYCKKNKIPRYMIINGLLTNTYLDEAKDADYFNAYSLSVKKNYFKGMDNVYTLGDPRMDVYYNAKKKNINREWPTIVIGASGFNNADLNAYTAIEFDFMYDVLSVLGELAKQGKKMNIIIKVRLNGYIEQYKNFVNEYFGKMNIEIVDTAPINEILNRTDYYISIYSQTLFEASALGIPVLYYKKDTEINHKPFDGESELVTAFDYDDLIKKIKLFYNGDPIYDTFLDISVLEKYIGHLDGRNLERNIDFIYSNIPDKDYVNKAN